ncbi:MAG: hypothetical protein LBS65_03950 [Desulfovibrio sp.]|jgi:hypothetical protein|nr:hypothetical protein [Desulfovibrio sp.]
MKISSEQIRIMRENERKSGMKPDVAAAFDAVLSREIDADASKSLAVEPAVLRAPAVLPGLETAPALSPGDMEKTPGGLEEEVRMFEGMLDGFEDYANNLALDERADLRGAFANLENIHRRLEDFKARFPDAAAGPGAAAEILNEMDVLATTEIIKFNRGDYLG